MEKAGKGMERKSWLDWAKGFAMLLVLIGHSMRDEMRQSAPALDMIYRIAYIFHMSYFFWISGYGYWFSRAKGRKPLEILGRRMKKQLPPWLLYALFIYAAFMAAIRVPALEKTLSAAGYVSLPLLSYLVQTLQANNPWAYHLWFLYVLILLTVILALADGLTGGRHTKGVCVVLMAVGIAGLAVRSFLNVGEWWRLYDYLTLYLPMICLGVLMADWKPKDWIVWLWGGLGIVYILVRAFFFSGFSGNSLRVEGAARFAVYLLADALLPGVMLLLNRVFQRQWLPKTKAGKAFLGFLGRESMIIYLVHQPFCCAFLGLILYNRLHLPAVPTMIVCLTVSVIVSWAAVKLAVGIKARRLKKG